GPLPLFDGGLELLDRRRALAPRAERGGRGGKIDRTVADAAVGKTPPFLRDLDQAQGAVVVDNSYEMNAVPHARLEIREDHREAAVADRAQHGTIRVHEFGGHRGGKTVAPRRQAVRPEEGQRPCGAPGLRNYEFDRPDVRRHDRLGRKEIAQAAGYL